MVVLLTPGVVFGVPYSPFPLQPWKNKNYAGQKRHKE